MLLLGISFRLDTVSGWSSNQYSILQLTYQRPRAVDKSLCRLSPAALLLSTRRRVTLDDYAQKTCLPLLNLYLRPRHRHRAIFFTL